jgi:ABC-2 type transport system ATP-binding protein
MTDRSVPAWDRDHNGRLVRSPMAASAGTDPRAERTTCVVPATRHVCRVTVSKKGVDLDPASVLEHGVMEKTLSHPAPAIGGSVLSASASALSAVGLRKAFEGQVVLDGIDLDVPPGTVFALLGPNGAGKTTTVQILSTLILPDAGEVRVAGHDLAQEPDLVRAAIGVTGQFSAVDDLLTGEENLILMADLHHLGRREGRRRAADLLRRFDLVETATKPLATYSGGMRRRLDLAMTLVGDPRIIFLDEPTTGLDPRSRRTMWQIIRDLVAGGVTIFLTTQYLEEADQLADSIAVLDHGKLVAEGTAAELKRLVPGGHIRLTFDDAAGLDLAARAFAGAGRDDDALALRVPSDGGVRSLRALLDRLDRESIEIDELSVHTPDLDDVFLALTGHSDTEKGQR